LQLFFPSGGAGELVGRDLFQINTCPTYKTIGQNFPVHGEAWSIEEGTSLKDLEFFNCTSYTRDTIVSYLSFRQLMKQKLGRRFHSYLAMHVIYKEKT